MMVASEDVAVEQTPLFRIVRYFVVAVRLVAVYVLVVLVIPVVVSQLSVEDSHLTIVPVWPDKVSNELLVPLQTDLLPAILPPTEAGSIVMVIVLVVKVPQPAGGIFCICPGGGEP